MRIERGGNHDTRDEARDGAIDPDIALITDYLMDALSREEHEAVDRRLEKDCMF